MILSDHRRYFTIKERRSVLRFTVRHSAAEFLLILLSLIFHRFSKKTDKIILRKLFQLLIFRLETNYLDALEPPDSVNLGSYHHERDSTVLSQVEQLPVQSQHQFQGSPGQWIIRWLQLDLWSGWGRSDHQCSQSCVVCMLSFLQTGETPILDNLFHQCILQFVISISIFATWFAHLHKLCRICLKLTNLQIVYPEPLYNSSFLQLCLHQSI